jgi:uncharacterized protein (DUF4415 family)
MADRPVIFDEDNPEWTDDDFARAKPLSAFPELEKALTRRGRPTVPAAQRKQLVSLRLSPEVLTTLRASGAGWQTRADELLRKGLGLAD